MGEEGSEAGAPAHLKKSARQHSSKKSKKVSSAKASKSANPSPKTLAWVLGAAFVVMTILFVAALATNGFKSLGTGSAKAIPIDQAQAKVSAYLTTVIGAGGFTVSNFKDAGDLYSFKISIQGKDYDSFMRKDGSLLFPTGVGLDAQAATTQQPAAQAALPKSDKPSVELFVMSYCPYGTQSEKGILPAVRALGSKIDFKIRFVYYAMHGQKEVYENLNQYCIQKEQPDKYDSYLACFLNASDSTGCLATAKVDTTKMDACAKAADTQFQVTANFNDQTKWLSGKYPLFNADADLNKQYGVGGSPTLIINGAQSTAGRDPASYLAAICNAFNTKPTAECNTQLSSTQPGPGFGYDSTAAATAAGCGA